jgi:hypothetical protein
MTLSNLTDMSRIGSNELNWKFFAYVDVEEGFWLWKRKRREQVCRKYAGYWFFVSTGKLTPAFQMEELAQSYEARTQCAKEV